MFSLCECCGGPGQARCLQPRPNYKQDVLAWNAATSEVLIDADRGSPPASRALCPDCRYPLSHAEGKWFAGTDDCARCGEVVPLSTPHFSCESCGSVVSEDEGPGVYIAPEYDLFNCSSGLRTVEAMEQGPKLQLHMRGLVFAEGGAGVAEQVLTEARKLGKQVEAEGEDLLDGDWEVDGVFREFCGAEEVCQLAAAARDLLASQGTLVEAEVPCVVFGDTHGQLRDVLLLFNAYGWPGDDERHFVFNGDFVDRGAHQVEVAMLMLALKVHHPEQVWLVRGNHEDDVVNKKYGFDRACMSFFGDPMHGTRVFRSFHNAFEQLPLACLVGGRALVVHGGIGKGDWCLDDIRRVRRPLTHDDIHTDSFIFNLLWSDPVEDDDPKEESTFGLHASPRGKSAVKFGWAVTVDFCLRNKLDLVVRSHQVKKKGFGFDVMHENMLIRVFSARDYEGHRNDGAILSITEMEDEEGRLVARPQLLRALAKS